MKIWIEGNVGKMKLHQDSWVDISPTTLKIDGILVYDTESERELSAEFRVLVNAIMAYAGYIVRYEEEEK